MLIHIPVTALGVKGHRAEQQSESGSTMRLSVSNDDGAKPHESHVRLLNLPALRPFTRRTAEFSPSSPCRTPF